LVDGVDPRSLPPPKKKKPPQPPQRKEVTQPLGPVLTPHDQERDEKGFYHFRRRFQEREGGERIHNITQGAVGFRPVMWRRKIIQ